MRRPLYVTLGILAVGWAIALPLMLADSGDDALPFEMTDDSKKYLRTIEQFGGKSSVFYAQLDQLLSSFFHGWRLGVTIAFSSCAVALIYYLRATRRT